MSAGIPDGWEWDYDGSRWFYRYKPTGQIQYHFPQPGDEFPDFIDAGAPPPDLAPEERLESQQQIKRRQSTATPSERAGQRANKSMMRATGGPMSSTPFRDDDDADKGYYFQPEAFMFLGPGAYNDVSPMGDEEDSGGQDEAKKEADNGGKGKEGENKTPQRGISPLASESTTPMVIDSQPVMSEPVTAAPVTSKPIMSESAMGEIVAGELVAREQILGIKTPETGSQKVKGDSNAVQSPDVPLLDSRERPYELGEETAPPRPAWNPVGFVAEMATEFTSSARAETHPDPIEMPDHAMLAPIETVIHHTTLAELPTQHSPVEQKVQEPLPVPYQGILASQQQLLRPQSEPTKQSPPREPPPVERQPQQSAYVPQPIEIPPIQSVAPQPPVSQSPVEQRQVAPSTVRSSTPGQFKITRKPTNAGATASKYQPYTPSVATAESDPDRSSLVLTDTKTTTGPKEDEGPSVRGYRLSIGREESLMIKGPQIPPKVGLTDVPSVLQPPPLPPKNPIVESTTVQQPPVQPPPVRQPPGMQQQTPSAPQAAPLTNAQPEMLSPPQPSGAQLTPGQDRLSHVPSVLRPARGQVENQSWKSQDLRAFGRSQQAQQSYSVPNPAAGQAQPYGQPPPAQPYTLPQSGQIPHSMTPGLREQQPIGVTPETHQVHTAPEGLLSQNIEGGPRLGPAPRPHQQQPMEQYQTAPQTPPAPGNSFSARASSQGFYHPQASKIGPRSQEYGPSHPQSQGPTSLTPDKRQRWHGPSGEPTRQTAGLPSSERPVSAINLQAPRTEDAPPVPMMSVGSSSPSQAPYLPSPVQSITSLQKTPPIGQSSPTHQGFPPQPPQPSQPLPYGGQGVAQASSGRQPSVWPDGISPPEPGPGSDSSGQPVQTPSPMETLRQPSSNASSYFQNVDSSIYMPPPGSSVSSSAGAQAQSLYNTPSPPSAAPGLRRSSGPAQGRPIPPQIPQGQAPPMRPSKVPLQHPSRGMPPSAEPRRPEQKSYFPPQGVPGDTQPARGALMQGEPISRPLRLVSVQYQKDTEDRRRSLPPEQIMTLMRQQGNYALRQDGLRRPQKQGLGTTSNLYPASQDQESIQRSQSLNSPLRSYSQSVTRDQGSGMGHSLQLRQNAPQSQQPPGMKPVPAPTQKQVGAMPGQQPPPPMPMPLQTAGHILHAIQEQPESDTHVPTSSYNYAPSPHDGRRNSEGSRFRRVPGASPVPPPNIPGQSPAQAGPAAPGISPAGQPYPLSQSSRMQLPSISQVQRSDTTSPSVQTPTTPAKEKKGFWKMLKGASKLQKSQPQPAPPVQSLQQVAVQAMSEQRRPPPSQHPIEPLVQHGAAHTPPLNQPHPIQPSVLHPGNTPADQVQIPLLTTPQPAPSQWVRSQAQDGRQSGNRAPPDRPSPQGRPISTSQPPPAQQPLPAAAGRQVFGNTHASVVLSAGRAEAQTAGDSGVASISAMGASEPQAQRVLKSQPVDVRKTAEISPPQSRHLGFERSPPRIGQINGYGGVISQPISGGGYSPSSSAIAESPLNPDYAVAPLFSGRPKQLAAPAPSTSAPSSASQAAPAVGPQSVLSTSVPAQPAKVSSSIGSFALPSQGQAPHTAMRAAANTKQNHENEGATQFSADNVSVEEEPPPPKAAGKSKWAAAADYSGGDWGKDDWDY